MIYDTHKGIRCGIFRVAAEKGGHPPEFIEFLKPASAFEAVKMGDNFYLDLLGCVLSIFGTVQHPKG